MENTHQWRAFALLAARKGLVLAGAFVAISFLLFLAIRAVPGDPVAMRVKHPDPERIQEIREELGLDRAWPVQYGAYIRDFWRGDWGRSLVTGRRVADEARRFFPATLELSLLALAWGSLAGVALAFLSEASRRRLASAAAYSAGLIGLTVPIFWTGLLLIVIGSLWLGWFPPGGRAPPGMETADLTGFLLVDALVAGRAGEAGEVLRHLFLPALCLGLYPAAQVCATLRARLRDSRIPALVAALRAKGLSERSITWRHLLRLVAAPAVTVTGTTFGLLLGGAVLTETVFSWPGMGRFLVAAVLDRDLYVVQNILLLLIFLVLAVVQVSDLIAAWLNPAALGGEETE